MTYRKDDDSAQPSDPDADSFKQRKVLLRRELSAHRKTLTDTEKASAAAGLAAGFAEIPEVKEVISFSTEESVGAYASFGGEPGTASIREFATARGLRVALPVIRPDFTLDWAWDTGVLEPGRNYEGVPEPAGEIVAHGPDGIVSLHCHVLLVPALAVDNEGYRMGKGGGFYDRLLGDLEHLAARPLIVAVVHDDEVVESIPREAHDHPVDAVLTPTRFFRIPGRREYLALD